jgi:AcrR family transcriptional regulator
MNYNKDTSEKILDTAFDEFGEKGFNGARMQAIADKAGINKSLLHYYYKSKDALFELIIKKAFNLLLPKVMSVFKADDDIFTIIEKFVDLYITLIQKHPQIPGFVIHEISNKPERLIKLIENSKINIDKIKERLTQEMENGTIIKMAPEQLVVNIISLTIFPFIAKPLVTYLAFNGDKNSYDDFINDRKKEVAKFVIRAIKI